ncbi:hypothetical protein Ddye_020559 [Dipteronia dyeriana]|uniref:LOB domain-containing protein n=1 Tax=Dipteronia dyeriana TaxID=168575 RepID=A0AAD9U107_9ROSI|nr:hypothetical protein Ddye_020559 [Dipteronia dyeriana]
MESPEIEDRWDLRRKTTMLWIARILTNTLKGRVVLMKEFYDAPYFPMSTYNDFHNAQKLFSVSKIQKVLHQKQATAESILRAGDARLSSSILCMVP